MNNTYLNIVEILQLMTRKPSLTDNRYLIYKVMFPIILAIR